MAETPTLFAQSLARLGFSKYDQYLASNHWRDKKSEYARSQYPQFCRNCRNPKFLLHHLTYARLGEESLDDFLPLCEKCHYWLHKLMKEKHWTEDPNKALKMLRRAAARPKDATAKPPASRPVQQAGPKREPESIGAQAAEIINSLKALNPTELRAIHEWTRLALADLNRDTFARKKQRKLLRREKKLKKQLEDAKMYYPKPALIQVSVDQAYRDRMERED